MHNLLAVILLSLLAVACQGNPIAPETPIPTPLPAAPKAVLVLGSGDVTPMFAVNFARLRFDASRSEGDGLTYLVEFGDGASSTEPVVMHRLQHGGSQHDHWTVTSRLIVTDRHGRTDSTEQKYLVVNLGPASLTSGHFAPAWVHRPGNDWNRDIQRVLTLTQQGATLGGIYAGPYDARKARPRTVSGTLTEDGEIRGRTDDGAVEFSGVVAWGTGNLKDTIILRVSIKDEMTAGSMVDFYYEQPPY